MTTKTKALDWSKPLVQRCGRAAVYRGEHDADTYSKLVEYVGDDGSRFMSVYASNGRYFISRQDPRDVFNVFEPAPVPIEWRTVRFWVAVSDSGLVMATWDEPQLPDNVRDTWKTHSWTPLKIVRTYQTEVTQ